MARELPLPAERFLRALARELSALSSTERDAVLLELRSHLIDRAGCGEAALGAALRALGSPADLAAGFHPGDGAGLVPVPRAFAVPWRRMRVGEVLLEVRATYLASRDGLMMVGLVLTAVTAATDSLWWPQASSGGFGVMVGAVMAAQYAAIMLAACAAFRILLSNEPRPWRVTRSTIRFAAASIAVDAITAAAALAVTTGITSLMTAAGASPALVEICRPIVLTAGSAVLLCVALRFQPWLVAQAVGRYEITPGASWRGTSGRVLNILRGWIVLVLPLYVLHIALHAGVPTFVPFGIATLPFAVMAGLVTMSISFMVFLLNATIFRWAVEEPIPSARPFAIEPADAAAFEEARARLAMLLATRPTGQQS